MGSEDQQWIAEQIVGNSLDAIVYADREGVVRLWNHGAEEMFGYAEAEALGQTLDLIIPERLRQRHWEGYDRAMAAGATKYGRDLLAVPAVRKDGSRISIEFAVALIRDAEGGIVGIAAIIRDVSTRWEEQRKLRARLAELEARAGATT